MAIDPNSIGAVTEPMLFEWTDRDTLLYAIGVGAGTGDLAFTTENSHGIDQQVLPTYAVICCPAFGAAAKVGTFNPAALLHGSQGIRLHAPLPAAGKLSVVTEVADIQDKGEGKNAIVVLRGRGCDPESGSLVAETLTTLVLRGQGGFGGARGERPAATATRCTATPGSPRSWPGFPSRSCTGCAPTGWRAGRWWPSLAAVWRPTSPRSPRGSPSRCFPARRCRR